MGDKIYSFQCLSHGEASSGSVMFDVRYNSEVVKNVTTARCPLCGNECGQFGPWREAKGEDTSPDEWRYKWSVAIQMWERVATAGGAIKREIEQLKVELAAAREAQLTKTAEAVHTMPPSTDKN